MSLSIRCRDAAEKSPQVIFLQVRDGDPSPEFLARFAEIPTPVKPVSAARIEPGRGVIDRATGEAGLIFRIDELEPEVDGGVTVKAGYYEAELSAAGDLYQLARRFGRWTIIRQAPLWIS